MVVEIPADSARELMTPQARDSDRKVGTTRDDSEEGLALLLAFGGDAGEAEGVMLGDVGSGSDRGESIWV